MTMRLGVAISGGGFRATAFGLGALRALHDRRLLPQVMVISGVSGGSVLTALYAYGPESFTEFDAATTELLEHGIQVELVRRALRPDVLTKGLISSRAP